MQPEFFAVAAAFLAVTALIVCAIGWALAKQRRRARRMREAARRIGFSFGRDGQTLLDEGLTNIPIFSLASLRHGEISNLLRGQGGSFSIVICDYHYWTGGGGRRFDYKQTVFCFDVQGTQLTDFSLRPRLSPVERDMLTFGLRLARAPATWAKPLLGKRTSELLDRALAAVEEKGVEFPGHPGFSARYQLRASDAEAAEALFQEGIVEAFEQQPQREALVSVEKAGNWLVVYRKNVLVKPEALGTALNEAISFRALFPAPRG